MTMEGSSESEFRKTDDSRDLSTSDISDRNLRLLHESRISLSADASRDSLFGTGRKARDAAGLAPSDHIRNRIGSLTTSVGDLAEDPFSCGGIEWGDVSLRKWLDNPERDVVASECLHIFRQIVEIVSAAHSQGIVVHNVRPSCFVMSSFNRVSFIESASCSDSGSDSPDEGSNCQNRDNKHLSPPMHRSSLDWGSRFPMQESHAEISTLNASQLVSETCCLMSSSGNVPTVKEMQGCVTKDCVNSEKTEDKESFPMKRLLFMESSWYTSPEEIAGAPSSCASDLYRFGVLLFELFCTFTSIEEKSKTMSSLRHRVLPPQLLRKWPKEASFCLWLLHPDPSSRPKMSDLLQSEFLNDPRDDIEEREAGIELREKIEEQELLMDFLMMMRHRKQEATDKLRDAISLLTSDIQEILSKQRVLRKKGCSSPEVDENLYPLDMNENEEAASEGSRKRVRPGQQTDNTVGRDSHSKENDASAADVSNPESLLFKNYRLMKNFKKLESAYLLTRRRPTRWPAGKLLTGHAPLSSNSRGSVVLTERSVDDSLSNEAYTKDVESGWISPFLEGLCKYLSFTKLKVKADLKQGDLLNSSNLVCSVSFDRDGEFFAVAGVNKKIKIFECDSILNEERDMHYPVVEMASRSKLSCVCWNGYIKSQVASSNFEGVVQVWDAARSQVFMELKEHERRVWSVDFSLADPTVLASGSDDGSVKLWSINQGTSIGTIKTKANVCCVQFPSDTGRSVAFGSADHRIYYYDLRYPKIPLCTLVGHNKTVSYVKFIDSKSLVSASTDNTVKLWDLSMCSSRVLDVPLQSYTGHMNMKNFVGLSVSDGYIATGSETNEVVIYHKAFPMPALSLKFDSTDPLSGHEVDDSSQFISSVCWRGQSSSTLVAANSTGDVRLLEMV